jgi:hypothetical protein
MSSMSKQIILFDGLLVSGKIDSNVILEEDACLSQLIAFRLRLVIFSIIDCMLFYLLITI